jgi:Fe-S oxidoreductase
VVIADKVHTLALDLGGTVSAQHATGLVRTQWVARQYGPLYSVFRQLKMIFDPRGIFNPGKIVDPDPRQATWPLRIFPGPDAATPHWQLRWQAGEVRRESAHCNGCGQCRMETPGRMCPVFHAGFAEQATPRAKANLLRNLLQQETDSRLLAADEVRAVADLCVNCKMCAHECPAHVNIPKLMLEAKAANVAQFGMDRQDWFFARMEGFVRWGSRLAPATNLLLGSRTARWLLQKLVGVSGRRRLPRFAYWHFLRLARRRGWTRKPTSPRPKVAYFVDVFATYNEPMLGEAVVALLQHQGFDVYVPTGQWGSGASALNYGDVETAREIASCNVRIFAELAREGYTIVCSEPTAALMFRQDYLDLLDDPDARLVAEHTVELTAFLRDLHTQGRLQTDFLPLHLSLGHHVPCHVKALGQVPGGPEILSLIPGVRVYTIDVSCSGMAGTFGLRAANEETSLAAGRPMLAELSQPQIQFGVTECSTCRIQMEDACRKRTLHPAQYLALAYGLLPQVAQKLKEPYRELVL